MNQLRVKDITKKYGDNIILDKFSIDIRSGEIACIMGKSGIGKTTILRCINNLEKVNDGSICINDDYLVKNGIYSNTKSQRTYQLSCGMVFQNHNLFPHLTIMENCSLALDYHKRCEKSETKNIVLKTLKKLSIEDKAFQYPHQLSGGQKQRAAIARSIVLNPKFICFDEPTSALDIDSSNDVKEIIKDLAKMDLGILVVTHDISLAENLTSKIIKLS